VRAGKAGIARVSDPRVGKVGESAAIARALLLSALMAGCGRSPRDEQPPTSQVSEPDGARQKSAASPAELATTEADARLREEAVAVDMGGTEARRAFELALIDPDPEARSAAIAGLAALGGDESARALAIVQTDSDPRLRQDAVHALGAIGGETSVRLLRQALLDDDAAVRAAAAKLLEHPSVLRR